jgi:large subunit ribosomal protein LP0
MVREDKIEYFKKLTSLLQEYSKGFLVSVNMVGSKQIQDVRMQMRGKGELLMGKNTMIRKCIRDNLEEMPHLAELLENIGGNTGLLFIKGDFAEISDILKANIKGASARAGVVAPIDVEIPKGVTSLQPTETSFFQALNIPTKITKGAIEILNDVDLVQKGSKVTPGASALLQKMGIKPFAYGVEVECVFENGSCYSPAVLSITDDDLTASFQAGLQQVASVCLASDYPTLVSVPHSIINGYKNVLSISLATDYTFPLAEKIKAFLSDPEAMAAAAAAAASSAPAAAGASAEAAPVEEEEEEEEEEEDMGFDLFD